MSSGKTHEKINIHLLVIILVISIFFFTIDYKNIFFMLIGYVVGTFYLGPDLDIVSRPFNNWKFLKFIWIPYQKLGHRSVWTHRIFISDVIRYIYLFTIILLASIPFCLMFEYTLTDVATFIKSTAVTHKQPIIWFFIGNVASSASHTITDKISTKIKRMRYRRQKKKNNRGKKR